MKKVLYLTPKIIAIFRFLLSKIFEKLIHEPTQEFLNKDNIPYQFQSGFRKTYSIDAVPIYLASTGAVGLAKRLAIKKAFLIIVHQRSR